MLPPATTVLDLARARDRALAGAAALARDPAAALRQLRRDAPDRPLVAHFCRLTPEPLVRALGALPVRLLDPPAGIDGRVDLHLQSYACRQLRAALSWALTASDALAAVMLTHTCDAMQCAPDLWQACSAKPVLALQYPTGLRARGAANYYEAELRRVAKQLGALTGVALSDEALARELDGERARTAALQRLYAARSRQPEALSAVAFYGLVHAGFLMPPAAWQASVDAVLAAWPTPPTDRTGHAPPRPRVALAGGPLLDLAVATTLDELGASVVTDDLCTGRRAFDAAPGEPLDRPPFAALAALALDAHRPPCPAHHRADHRPGADIVRLARQCGAQGVLFVAQKYCEPYAFDVPLVRAEAAAAGLPFQLIELDPAQRGGTLQEALSGSDRVRLAAFLEQLAHPTPSVAAG